MWKKSRDRESAGRLQSTNRSAILQRSDKIICYGCVCTLRGSQNSSISKNLILGKSCFLRIGFVGSSAPYKGLPELLAAADELYLSGVRNFTVEVFGCDACGKHCCDVNYHGAFTSAEADRVYRSMDLLVVPSVCYETFGFIAVEALSRGIGVIASDMVGAKILLDEKSVYHTREELCWILKRLLADPAEIENISRNICSSAALETVAEHSRKMVDFYSRI